MSFVLEIGFWVLWKLCGDIWKRKPASVFPARCFHCLRFIRDKTMVHKVFLVIISICVGSAFGILIAVLAFFGMRWYKKHAQFLCCTNEQVVATHPIHTDSLGTSTDFSDSLSSSIAVKGSRYCQKSSQPSRQSHHSNDHFLSASGIPRYSYK